VAEGLISLDRVSSSSIGAGNNLGVDHVEHRWDIVDAVSRSPLFNSAELAAGVDLAHVERFLLTTELISASELERLIDAVRELARIYQDHR
jgi:hypothetical protein